jgi:hypothetical protein
VPVVLVNGECADNGERDIVLSTSPSGLEHEEIELGKPRLGRDGRLRLPISVTVSRPAGERWPGDVRWEFERHRYDPEADKPFLIDPFERRADGLLLIESFVRLDLRRPRKARDWFLANGVPNLAWFDQEPPSSDAGREILIEQELIRQYITVIERISRILPPPAGPGEPWDPDWFPVTNEVFGNVAKEAPEQHARILFEITMDSIATYLMRAMFPMIDPLGARARPSRPTFPGAAEVSVGPVLSYKWESIIAPIYLQLYEALRRLSEGRPGARTCPACGQTFLMLDGRRERFCTDLERASFNMRAFRKRRGRLAA